MRPRNEFEKQAREHALNDSWKAAHPEPEQKQVKPAEEEFNLAVGPELVLSEGEKKFGEAKKVGEIEFTENDLANFEDNGIVGEGIKEFDFDPGDGKDIELHDKKNLPN